MAGELLISVEDVSKKFCRNLKRSMWYGMKDIAGEVTLQGRSRKLRKGEFWALKDASLEVRRGEVVGIIGHNGAGKTTMLRAINGLIKPDAGKITVRGEVGALIQLGAGFNPVLSGRENIQIAGMIRGMSKKEIHRKFDDIVEFSGIKDFLDSPVRTYSSGMTARLGFSIAAHLEPDVLLIDEVLSVGDADFKARSMEKMWKMARSGETAIVFVSHMMTVVDGFCDRIILMERGVPHAGAKGELIARYYGDNVSGRLQQVSQEDREKQEVMARIKRDKLTGDVEIESLEITDGLGARKEHYSPFDSLKVRVRYRAKKRLENVVAALSIEDPGGLMICVERTNFYPIGKLTLEGSGELEIDISPIQLKSGKYYFGVSFQEPAVQVIYGIRREDSFTVVDAMPSAMGRTGFFKPNVTWNLQPGNVSAGIGGA